MTEFIDTAPKDGTKILCICSDGKTRYCWWFGCSDVDGFWMTAEAAEPVAWHAQKRPLPSSLKEQALKVLNQADKGLMTEFEWQQCCDTIRRALESLPE